MPTVIDNLMAYFSKKDNAEETQLAPEGMCPICWGHSEYDGQYYKLIKDKHLTAENDIYKSFISEIADKYVNSTHKHEDKYSCTTCHQEF